VEITDIRRIAVIGAGIMGHGIAQEFAVAGHDVGLHDVDETRLRDALTRIAANLARLETAGVVPPGTAATAPTRIHPSTSLGDATATADYVVEAAPENLPLKRDLFAELDRLCAPATILASNTSTFVPSSLATATGRPDRVLVTHYFNPPFLVPLVEVVRGPETSDATVSTVFSLLKRIGKSPVVVQKEAPGFIGNRLQLALVREALSIVAQGLATPEDVDLVVRTSLGRRWSVAGPFETSDAAGLDTVLAVAGQLFPAIESSPAVPSLLQEVVARGHLGLKTGKGFYDWPPDAAEELRERIRQALIEIARWEANGESDRRARKST
jgi:3-hydroxybutyryl-CoA dehydrogenase